MSERKKSSSKTWSSVARCRSAAIASQTPSPKSCLLRSRDGIKSCMAHTMLDLSQASFIQQKNNSVKTGSCCQAYLCLASGAIANPKSRDVSVVTAVRALPISVTDAGSRRLLLARGWSASRSVSGTTQLSIKDSIFTGVSFLNSTCLRPTPIFCASEMKIQVMTPACA